MDEIKPVAWMLDTDSCTSLSAPLAQANRGGSHTEPLYSQQSIDALRAEVERLQWQLYGEINGKQLVEAEAEALRADAERYRWLSSNRVRLRGEEGDFELRHPFGHLFYETLDQSIDAARKGAE